MFGIGARRDALEFRERLPAVRLGTAALAGHHVVIETIEEIHEGTVGLSELLLPGDQSLGTMLVIDSNWRRAHNAHFHLLSSGLVNDVQDAKIELVAIVTHFPGEFLERPVGVYANTIVKLIPEVGGAHGLSLFTFVQELNNICEGFENALLSVAYLIRSLFEQGGKPTLFTNPRNFFAVTERLYDSICITCGAHIQKTTHLRFAHAIRFYSGHFRPWAVQFLLEQRAVTLTVKTYAQSYWL